MASEGDRERGVSPTLSLRLEEHGCGASTSGVRVQPEAAEILAEVGIGDACRHAEGMGCFKPTFNLRAFVNELDYAVAYPTSEEHRRLVAI